MGHIEEILSQIVKGKIQDKLSLQQFKKKVATKFRLKELPSDSDLLAGAGSYRERVLHILKRKPSRTMSGVAVIAVMTKPSKCPHGMCIYCPGGIEINTPQSYIGKEPAAMRGIQYKFDSYTQTISRIKQLEEIGHACDKIELIIMGGTFTAQPLVYQRDFVKGCFDAMNGKQTRDLIDAQQMNERAKYRCVGLTIETRPDWCKERQIDSILNLGCTRVELGVQNPDDNIYTLVKRGHTVQDVIDSTRLLKDSLLKVNYHIMPGMPGSDLDKDLKMFKKIFESDSFKPDMLKIYPCLLVKPEFGQPELHKMYEKREWTPYTNDQAAELIAEAKRFIPKWVRIMRIQRDIPSPMIQAGVKASNLRQLVHEKLKHKKTKCNCIRCREIKNERPAEAKLLREDYDASGGKEIFLSMEDTVNDKILGFLRLRKPGKSFRPEIDESTMGVRELHVYGPMVGIDKKPNKETQHRGYGEQLMREAERIAKEEFDAKKLAVISGIGVREYYYKLGYRRDGPYVSKPL
jgi:elongator complex protein 3